MCKAYRDRMRRKRRYLWAAQQGGRCADCREPATWFAEGRGPIPAGAAMMIKRRGAFAVVCSRCAVLARRAAQALDHSAPIHVSDRLRATMGLGPQIEDREERT
jgi:hypothetical protein